MIFADLVAPLEVAFRSRAQLEALVDDLGWQVALSSEQHDAFKHASGMVEDIEQLALILADIADGGLDETNTEQLLDTAFSIYEGAKALGEVDLQAIASLPEPFDTRQGWEKMALRLPEYLVISYLDGFMPLLSEALSLLRIIAEGPVETEPGSATIRTLDWQALSALLSDPENYLKTLIGWPDAFDYVLIQTQLLRVAGAFGFRPDTAPLRQELIEAWLPGNTTDGLLELQIPLVDAWFAGGRGSTSLALLCGPAANQNGNIAGFGITNLAAGSISDSIPLGNGWKFAVSAEGELDRAIEAKILTSGVEVAVANTAAAAIRLDLDFQPESPTRLFGGGTGPRLELSGFGIGISVDSSGGGEFALHATTLPGANGENGFKLIIAPGEGDSFIAEILGDLEMEVDATIAVRWSSTDGFAFEGGVGFDVVIPVDLKLGPVFLSQIRIAMAGGADGLTIEGAVSGGLDVAVLAVVVEDIGLRASVVPAAEGERGMLGPVDLKLGFKPPKGIGIAINAGDVVSGGGYLYHDETLAEYGGVAELGFLSLKLSAIGMLTTRMPDGEDGWSLFLAIFSEFPPIQLAFGFTLNGVGGLVGLHRTFDDEALRERLLAGALDSIMFPQDPVANAPQILSDIRAVFPPSRGQFVFGVMLKLGWGTPSIVSLELGVIVELPDPIKIALLGQLGMILPKPDATLVEINMDMFGVANLTEGTLAMDATIRDSHIMHLLTLSGDMAFRAEFGDRPNMLMSIGGFHPDFEPPASAPNLRRMKAALPLGKYAAVELSGYVAVTSNSFQTGGRIDIWVKVAGLSAEGWFGFDALIQFSPFGFKFTTEIGFSVSFKSITLLGVDVWLQIVGPAPWELDGYAKVKICGFKKKLTVDLELGRKTAVAVPSYDVMDMLVKALEDPESWSVGEGAGTPLVVYAKKADGTSALDPRGNLSFRQKVVPLNKAIGKFGNGTVIGTDLFTVEDLEAGGTSLSPDYLDDWFAPAEFEELTDEQKLARPSFQEMDGGASFGGNPPEMGGAFDGEEGYEDIVLDPADNRRSKAGGVEKREGRTVVTSAQSLKSEGPAPRPMRLRKQVFEPARSIPVRTMEKYKGGASRSGAVKTITSAAVKDGTIMRAKSAGRRRFQ